jgi:putative Mg2+ transporter-C (MgtC) family protein
MLELFIKLTLAFLIGAAIGTERELHFRPAGLRTHMLVILGATLIMHLNVILAINNPVIDPARMGAQIVSGIGFLGAGTIIREGNSITGLTTAASLWTIAAIGIGIGMGAYIESVLAALFTLLILILVTFVDKKLKVIRLKKEYMYLTLKSGQDINTFKDMVTRNNLDIQEFYMIAYKDGLYVLKIRSPLKEVSRIIEVLDPVNIDIKEK